MRPSRLPRLLYDVLAFFISLANFRTGLTRFSHLPRTSSICCFVRGPVRELNALQTKTGHVDDMEAKKSGEKVHAVKFNDSKAKRYRLRSRKEKDPELSREIRLTGNLVRAFKESRGLK